MEAILEFAQQLYRTAQNTSTDSFQDFVLGALGGQVRFEAALWFTGHIHAGQFQFHRLHAHRMPLAGLDEVVALVREYPRALERAAAAPCCAHLFDAAELYAEPDDQVALEQVRRWRMERQLLIATASGNGYGGEWLSLHRPRSDRPFDETDRETLRLLMPHLAESRSVNRAVCLRQASTEPLFASGPHRALTLPDGTVLHCGRRISEAIEARWPHWGGARLPAPLLADLSREGSVRLAVRGETLVARKFSDAFVLTIKAIPITERLTRREYEVARLFGAGGDYRDIARRCAIAPATVRNIVQKSYRKLGINSKAQLARLLSRADGGA